VSGPSDDAGRVRDGARVVLMTAPSHEVAEGIVTTLVQEGVVACGNILPGVTSIYRWQGALQNDQEVLVVLKTTERRVAELLTRAPALHPYDVPELLVLDVTAGHGPYMDWLAGSVNVKAES
jgi:periplasmic divalent cation tolerance protein